MIKWLKYELSIMSLLLSIVISAQEMHDELWMEPDRPGMATGTGVMPFKKVMWETGFEWGKTDDCNSVVLPTTMLRVGISKFAELRLEYDGCLLHDGGKWSYKVEPIILGTKIKVFEGSEQHKWIPKISLMANLAIPSTKTLAEEMHVAPSIYALFSNDVNEWFNIGYNIGAEWDGYTATPATFLAVCLGFSITDNLGAFVECYNYFTKYGMGNTEAEANIDLGLNWLVHKKVQLDIYAGINCQDPKNGIMAGLGVAWLIN